MARPTKKEKRKKKTLTKIAGRCVCLCVVVREAESRREMNERVRGEAEN